MDTIRSIRLITKYNSSQVQKKFLISSQNVMADIMLRNGTVEEHCVQNFPFGSMYSSGQKETVTDMK